MRPTHDPLAALKTILKHIAQPQKLNQHPWTKSLVVAQVGKAMPEVLKKTPGQQLVLAIADLFGEMMPGTAPRRGKRLDTRWGEFGILAARYFAPLLLGEPAPASLQEAWEKMDASIRLFVEKKTAHVLTEEERKRYEFAGGEILAAPSSTLSDWHRKGIQRLLSVILARENHLVNLRESTDLGDIPKTGRKAGPSGRKDGKKPGPKAHRRYWLRISLFVVLSLLAVTGIYGGWKATQLYQQVQLIRADALRLEAIATGDGPILTRYEEIGPALGTLRQDLEILKEEAGPTLWVGPWLAWVPVHGGDLASAEDLMRMTDSLLASAEDTYQAMTPLLEMLQTEGLDPVRLTEEIVQMQPQLEEARRHLELAVAAREGIPVEDLSPEVNDLIVNKLDPLIPLVTDGLTLAGELPGMLGATEEGPKTYLLLVQNEDELRPTGGFITAVGTVLIQDGRIVHLEFEDSGELEDWSKPYPAAPWQLREYMNSSVLVLRDANWFTHYPTTVLYAETLYAYVRAHSVDGVIAFDQQMLVEFLKVSGPLDLEGSDVPIDSSNVIDYMRSAKTPTAEEKASGEWDRKFFIQQIADALIEMFYNGDIQPEHLLPILLRSLDEHHMLIQVDNPYLTSLLARTRWDGAVRPELGDFLMVVDSNIGFNKTSAVVEAGLVYEVDLHSEETPRTTLTVTHTNDATTIICKHWFKIWLSGEKDYTISDCYWNYLRVYTAAGTTLLDSETQAVPGYWMIHNQDVPAGVDVLEEGIPGVQAFGTLQVIPGQETEKTVFSFALPEGVLETQPGGLTVYRLLVQKQPGTLAVPLTIQVNLPEGARIVQMPVGAVNQGESILFRTELRTDVRFEITFELP